MNQTEMIEKMDFDSMQREQLIASARFLRAELLRERSRIGVLHAEIRSLAARLEIAETRLSTAQTALDLYRQMQAEIDEIASVEQTATAAA